MVWDSAVGILPEIIPNFPIYSENCKKNLLILGSISNPDVHAIVLCIDEDTSDKILRVLGSEHKIKGQHHDVVNGHMVWGVVVMLGQSKEEIDGCGLMLAKKVKSTIENSDVSFHSEADEPTVAEGYAIHKCQIWY